MLPKFNERKTTQVVALLVERAGGSMNYLKVLKLLYIIDREALKRWHWPVTFDEYVSMKLGPVLSNTYNLIKSDALPSQYQYWHQYISDPQKYGVSLVADPPEPDDLSEAEIELAGDVYDHFEDVDKWTLSELTHRLPEWRDPGGSSIPIDLPEILHAVGKTDEECEDILSEIGSWGYVEQLLRSGNED